MKKTILALLLVVALIVCFGAITASAEETAHEHCYCNGTVSGNDAHTCESVTWTPISVALEEAGLTVETADFGKLPDGNYYLDADVIVTKASAIGSSQYVKDAEGNNIDREYSVKKEIAICLNGHKITTTTSRPFGAVYYGSKLVITDCSGKQTDGTWTWDGTVEGGNSGTGTILYTYAGSTFEIYGGNFVAREGVQVAYGLFCISSDSYMEADGKAGLTDADRVKPINASYFNMYNGNVVGGYATKNGGAFAFWHCAQVNIYGGSITGGHADGNGGNITVTGSGTDVKILGGTISGGTLGESGHGADIHHGSGKLTLDTAFGTLYYTHGGKDVSITLGENFSAEKVLVDSISTTKLVTIVSQYADYAQVGCFEAKDEGDTLYANKKVDKENVVKLLQADVDDGKHYACNCGGAYASYHSKIGHTSCSIRSTWQDLSAFLAEQNIEAGAIYDIPAGSYYLSADLTLDHYLRVAKDTTVYIDLNGYTLTGAAQPSGNTPLLRLNGSGAELYITDSSFDASATTAEEAFKGAIAVSGTNSYPLMYANGSSIVRVYGGKLVYTGEKHKTGLIATSGEIRFFNGYIYGGKSSGNGASIAIYDSGKVTMYGGEITGGETTGNGGNIFVDKDKGKISMLGGIISDGKAAKGGNIYLSRGTLDFSGGTITGGNAATIAGNVYVNGGYSTATDETTGVKSFTPYQAKMTMSGGVISNGIAGAKNAEGNYVSGQYAGNVYIHATRASTSYTVNAGTETEEKVSVAETFKGTFTMSGGTITGGESYNAGNIDVFGEMTMTGGVISDGFAQNEGGNIRIYYIKDYDADGNEFSATTFTMDGGEITGGYAGGNGGSILTYGITNLNTGKITGGEAANMGGNLRPFRPAIVTIGENFEISGGKADKGGNLAASGSYSESATAWPFYTNLTIKGTIINGTAAENAANCYIANYTVATIDGATVKGGEGDFDNYLSGNAQMTVTGAADMGTVFMNNRDTTLELALDLTGLTKEITLDAYVLGNIATATEASAALVSTVEGKTVTFNEGNIVLDSTEVISIADAGQLTEITVEPYASTYYAINSQLNGQYITIEGATGMTVILNGTGLTKSNGIYVAELTGTPVNQLIVTNSSTEVVTVNAGIAYKEGSEGNPIVINAASELTSVKAAAGETTYYAINSMLNGMTLTVVSAEGVTVTVNGVELAADENGLITVTLTGAPMNKVAITNAGEEAVELVAALEWPLGSQNNPIVIHAASELTTVEAGKYYAISSMLNGNFIVIEEAAGVVTLNGTALTAENGYYVAELTGAPMNMLTATATAAAEIVAEKPEFEPEIVKFDIDVARMILGNALEFQFGVSTTKIPDKTGFYAVIEKTWADGTTTTKTIPAEDWGKSGSYHAIVYDGLAAKEMGDTFYVTIYNADGVAVSNAKQDAVRDYVDRAYASQKATGKTMMVDMLNYGAAAQVHFSYGTDDLANSKLTDAQKASGTAAAPTMTNNVVKGTNYQGSRFILESRIQVQVGFKGLKDTMYAIYTYTDNNGNTKEVRIEGKDFVASGSSKIGVELSALVYADARALVDIVIYNADGTVHGTASDSIESCCARSTGDVFTALMKFADSARKHLYNK